MPAKSKYKRKTPVEVSPATLAYEAFDPAALKQVCEIEAEDFEVRYGMTRVEVDQSVHVGNFYLFKDNGARVLAVAHLDTVEDDRTAHIMDTADGPVIFSGALDDRLGAYVIAELLPRLGLTYDLLFTVGEEQGQSTAEFFDPADHHDRTYDWIIEFDRGGTDVVLYQYEDEDMIARVKDSGAWVGNGAFSDISFMESLGTKAINWGVGYRDYHGPRSHAWLVDTFEMVGYYLVFAAQNHGIRMEHTPSPGGGWGSRGGEYSGSFEYIIEDCEEWDQGASTTACDGTVNDTVYGLLCKTHRDLYLD